MANHIISKTNHYYHLHTMSQQQKPIIVSLEGNIGAGKSTLLEELEKHLERGEFREKSGQGKWLFLKEPVHLWNEIKSADGETLLSKFYADPAKYAFAFQIMAFTTRLSELRRLLREMPADCLGIICERSLDADKHIFAKMLHADGLIEDVLYTVYEKYFAEYLSISGSSILLKGVIYVDAEPAICLDRVRQRSRNGEGGISLEYLEKCRDYHERWLNGVEPNGVEPNGVEPNGVEPNGVEPNGVEPKTNTVAKPAILHLHTNPVASFDPSEPNDAGNKWLLEIRYFLETLQK